MKKSKIKRSRPGFTGANFIRGNEPLWILFLAALLIGGGGRDSQLSNLVVQLIALAIAWFGREQLLEGWRRLDLPLKILLVLTYLVPILHLIPLPATLWSSLPGREVVAQSYQLIGLEGAWAPISMTPSITALALTGLIAPTLILLLIANLSQKEQWKILVIIGACGVVNLAFGAVQLMSQNEFGNLYGSRVPDYLYGLFVGHNASGMFFFIATLSMIELVFRYRLRGAALVLATGAGLLFFIATFLTQSRAAIAMQLISVILLSYHLMKLAGHVRSPKRSMTVVAASLVAVVVVGVGLASSAQNLGRLSQVVERFESDTSNRPELWSDAYVSAETYWPVGSGVGTFDEVFQLDESLETLVRLKAGRAHNEYLEIAIDSGLLGVLTLFMWLVYALFKLSSGGYRHGISRAYVGGIIFAFAAHSMLDFPLRNQAMLCMAGMIVGLLNGMGRERHEPSSH